jgi:predicted nucleic acid-binding protein
MRESRQPLRVYADTSVIGGVFDEEFAEASRAFFEQVRSGRFRLVTSAVVVKEIEAAPKAVQDFFDEFAVDAEVVEVTEEVLRLQQAYLDAGILSPQWSADALHVALAAVSRCSVIVSWNFQHIVHFRKIPLYTAITTVHGYAGLSIHSPAEVIAYEDENS